MLERTGEKGIYPSNYVQKIIKKTEPRRIGGNWYELYDGTNDRHYYVNKKLGKKQWKWPEDVPKDGTAKKKTADDVKTKEKKAAAPKNIGKGWFEMYDPTSKRKYYVNKKLGKKQWKWPEDLSESSTAVVATAAATTKTSVTTTTTTTTTTSTDKTKKVIVEDDDMPEPKPADKTKPRKIGKGWYQLYDKRGKRHYYVNKSAGKKQWSWPKECDRPKGEKDSDDDSDDDNDVSSPAPQVVMLDAMGEVIKTKSAVLTPDIKEEKVIQKRRKPKKLGKTSWYELYDAKNDRLYYINKKTKKRQWKWPEEVPKNTTTTTGPSKPIPSTSQPKPPTQRGPPTLAPPVAPDTKIPDIVNRLGETPNFSNHSGVDRNLRGQWLTAVFEKIEEENEAKRKKRPLFRLENGKEVADFSFMKENKFGVGARRAMHLAKERGHLTLQKNGKDAKKFHIGRIKAVEKNSSKEAVLIFGVSTGRDGKKSKKKQRPYELTFDAAPECDRFVRCIRAMMQINSANKAVKTGLTRNASTAASFAGSRSQFHMKSQARMLSQASLMNLSGIDLVSQSSSNSVNSADGGDALETSFKICKTNKFGVSQERILEFVPLKASDRKDVNAEGGMEMRVSTLRGEKKKGFDVDFITHLVKDKSDDHKLTILFGAPFYYSMLKTLAYMEEDPQRPYLLEFREQDARESFCKTLLWAQNSSRESYRAYEYQKKMERLRDMNTTLWNCSFKGKTHRWEPHELFWRAASGIVR